MGLLAYLSKGFSLGKGLSSLIPIKSLKHIEPQTEKTDSVFYIEVNKIKPNPSQPRKDFDETGIKELANSIKKYGILQPLLVNKIEKETPRGLEVFYQLIAGERRLKAAKIANLPHVPVIIKDVLTQNNDNIQENLEIALIENLQRQDLNPMDEAEAYKKLHQDFHMSYDQIAVKVAMNPKSVINIIRLLNLPSDIQKAVRDEKISMGHARALLAIKDEDKIKQAFNQVLTNKISVRETEALASQISGRKSSKNISSNIKFKQLQMNLSEKLETPVLISAATEDKGKISIRFSNLEHLNTIVKKILD